MYGKFIKDFNKRKTCIELFLIYWFGFSKKKTHQLYTPKSLYFLLTSFLIPYILKYEWNLQNRVNVLTKHIAEVHDTFVWNHVCLFFFIIHSNKINNGVTVTYLLCWDTHSLQDVSINQVWYIVDTLWGSKFDPDRRWISFWSYKRILVHVWDDSDRLLCLRQIFL